MTKKYLLGAGAALALSLVAAQASAQNLEPPMIGTSQPTAPSGPTAPSADAPVTGRFDDTVPQSACPSERHVVAGGRYIGCLTAPPQPAHPPMVMTPNVRDAFGLPQTMLWSDAVAYLGSEEAAMLAAEDDRAFCSGLWELDAINEQIRLADLEMAAANEAVANARTRAERQAAEARRSRAENNLWQLLWTGIRVGLVSQIPGVGWAYGGYILSTEAAQWFDRRQHGREMEASDAYQDLFMAQNQRFELVLRRIELRVARSDIQGNLFQNAMGQWCNVMGYGQGATPTRVQYVYQPQF